MKSLSKMGMRFATQKGAGILEYAQLCGLVAAVAAVGLTAMGTSLNTFFEGFSQSVSSLSAGAVSGSK